MRDPHCESARRPGLGGPADDPGFPVIDRRFVIVAGKGGVGRTTVACALALLAARRGKRVLLCQMRAKGRLARLLGQPVDEQVRLAGPNLWAVSMEPHAALHEYGMIVLRFPAVVRAVFDSRPLRAFFRGVPGLHEFALLGKACYHAGEHDRFDTVILDGPATGHLLQMLRLPAAVAKVTRSGPLAREARAMDELLRDGRRAVAHIVTLAEEMPVSESLDLHRSLCDLGLPLGRLVINALVPDRWAAAAPILDRLGDAEPPSGIREVLNTARAARDRYVLQQRYVQRLEEELPLPRILLPMRFVSALGHEDVVALSRSMEDAS